MLTVSSPAEERTILHHVSWKTYECLLEDFADSSAPRFTFDRGTLEIMSPREEHERSNRTIALLVEVVTEERGLEIDSLGSTTFKREDVGRGFEPDSCFYLQNAERVRGKDRIDLRIDPPPDLVIEIDITHSSLDKLPIYAQFGVPEVWRYNGQALRILVLEEGAYHERDESLVLPGLDGATLTGFVAARKTLKRPAWLRSVREWARGQGDPGAAR
jgi:Uma2 family endonuclease